jgi:hypothetical protein
VSSKRGWLVMLLLLALIAVSASAGTLFFFLRSTVMPSWHSAPMSAAPSFSFPRANGAPHLIS